MDNATDRPFEDNSPEPGSTAYLLQEMQLYGYRPFEDEPDPRPLPDARLAGGAVADMFDGLVSALTDRRLEANGRQGTFIPDAQYTQREAQKRSLHSMVGSDGSAKKELS